MHLSFGLDADILDWYKVMLEDYEGSGQRDILIHAESSYSEKKEVQSPSKLDYHGGCKVVG